MAARALREATDGSLESQPTEGKIAQLGTVVLKGRSGRDYGFSVYPWDEPFRAVAAVYVVARRASAEGVLGSVLAELVGPRQDSSSPLPEMHSIIYVGETDDLSTRLRSHPDRGCFDTHGADCVCMYEEDDPQRRIALVADLRDRYEPTCNRP